MAYVNQIQIPTQNKYDIHASGIPYAQVDSSSTSTDFTATVPGITSLEDGTCVLLKNGQVTSASGFTININGLGDKPVYNNLATGNDITPTDPTRDTTIFNINYTMLFIYNSTLVDGGCWICYRGYDANTNTIGYQLRTNSGNLEASDTGYKYRLWFTSADGTKWVPANTSTSTNATTARTMNTRPINPFGPIVYNSTNGTVNSGARPAVSTLWQQYALTIGYSYVVSLTAWDSVYVQCTPQTNGSAVMNAIVKALPTSNDGKIYIYLGMAYSTTAMELRTEHPVFYHDGNGIKVWTGTKIPSKTSDLTNDSGFITSADVPEGSVASTTTPKMDGTAAVGTESAFARGDHVHPTDTTRASTATFSTSANGLVPKPASAATNSYLNSSGTWTTPPNTTYALATTAANGLMSAADKKKLDACSTVDNNSTYSLTQNSSDGHKLIWTANGGTPSTFTIPDNNTTYDLSTIAGTLSVAKGGTGATNAAGARTNLQVPSTATATTAAAGLMSSTDKQKLDACTTFAYLADGTNGAVLGDILNNTASGTGSVAEGQGTTASGNYSHTEGSGTIASSNYSHAEGNATSASEIGSHAEGYNTTASGYYSHAEGGNTRASGHYSHSEGVNTLANGSYSHAEGWGTTASGQYSHAGGSGSTASQDGAFVHGLGLGSSQTNQVVFGKYNELSSTASLVIGGGTATNTRRNVFTISTYGDVTLAAPAASNSPSLVFQRGILTDNYNDWQIQNRGGFLYFDQRGSGSSNFSNQVVFNTSGNISANSLTATGGNIQAGGYFVGNGSCVSNLNASSLSTGTVPSARLPLATTAAVGAVKPDGTSISVDSNGVISANNSGGGLAPQIFEITMSSPEISINASYNDIKTAFYSNQGCIFAQNVSTDEKRFFQLINLIQNYSGVSGMSVFKLIAIDTTTQYVFTFTTPSDTTSPIYGSYSTFNITANSTYSLAQSTSDGHKLIWKGTGVTPTTFTIPDNGGSTPLIGTTATVTPTQVKTALRAGTDICLEYHGAFDQVPVDFRFTSWNGATDDVNGVALDAVVSNTIVYYNDNYYLFDLTGIIASAGTTLNSWFLHNTNLGGGSGGFTYIAEDSTYGSVKLGGTEYLVASGTNSVAQGSFSIASGDYSHAEGDESSAEGIAAHAEGYITTASGNYSHSEGFQTLASTSVSHAEGYGTTAAGLYSHAEGRNNIASANQAHVGGYGSTAAAVNNFVHGSYLVSSKDNQSVLGQYNAQDSNALFIVGNGTSTASADRSNAFIVNQSGRVTAGANAVGLKDLVTLDQLVPVGSIIRNNISDANVMNTLYPNMTWVQKYGLWNGEQTWPSSDNLSGSYKEIIVPAYMGVIGTGATDGLNFTITIPGLKDSGITANDLDVWAEGNTGVIGRFIDTERYYIYKKKSGVVSFTIKYVDGDNVGLCTGSTANFTITNNTSGSGTAVTKHHGGTCWLYSSANNPHISFEISSSYDLGMYIWKRTS